MSSGVQMPSADQRNSTGDQFTDSVHTAAGHTGDLQDIANRMRHKGRQRAVHHWKELFEGYQNHNEGGWLDEDLRTGQRISSQCECFDTNFWIHSLSGYKSFIFICFISKLDPFGLQYTTVRRTNPEQQGSN